MRFQLGLITKFEEDFLNTPSVIRESSFKERGTLHSDYHLCQSKIVKILQP